MIRLPVLTFLFSLLFTQPLFAQDFAFDDISQQDLENIIRDFSAAHTHTSVSSGESMGLLGVEIGLVGSLTDTPEVERLVREETGQEVSQVPAGGILARVGFMDRFVVEAVVLPDVDVENASFTYFSLAGQMSVYQSDMVNLALKAHLTSTELEFNQQLDGADATVSYENQIMGLQVIASRSFLLFEPYIGVGYLQASGEMGATGSGQLFDFTVSQSAKTDESSAHLFGGVEVDLFLFKAGLEAASLYDTNRFSVKLTTGF